MKKIIVMIEPPSLNKNRHAKLLSQKLGYKYFSLGDVIAEEVKKKTKIGLIMEKYSNSNITAPDEYSIMLMKDAIINLKEDGIVFDGFPESVAQAKSLDSFLFSRKNSKPIPVLFDSEQTVVSSNEYKNIAIHESVVSLYDDKMKLVANYYDSSAIKINTSNKSVEQNLEEVIKWLSI